MQLVMCLKVSVLSFLSAVAILLLNEWQWIKTAYQNVCFKTSAESDEMKCMILGCYCGAYHYNILGIALHWNGENDMFGVIGASYFKVKIIMKGAWE